MSMRLWVCVLVAVMYGDARAAEECLLDQNTRHEDNLALQKRYPGSHYIREKYTVIIPIEDGTISINKGGCVHYGMDIELRTSKTRAFQNEKAFINKILELAKDYASNMLDIDKLRKTLDGKRWQKVDGTYFVDYEGYTAFEIGTRDDDAFTYIGMRFYD